MTVFDFWVMKRGVFWSTRHNTVVQKILKRARHHTSVVFIPGNHDEALREHVAAIKEIGGIRYINCGDWVDSCTAVLEHRDGRMELLEWEVHPASNCRIEVAANTALLQAR